MKFKILGAIAAIMTLIFLDNQSSAVAQDLQTPFSCKLSEPLPKD